MPVKTAPAEVADLIPPRAAVPWWNVRAWLRRFLDELTDDDRDELTEVVVETEQRHDDHLVRCQVGQHVQLFGRARAVVFHPGYLKRTTVTLHDGTGTVEVVFTGPERPKGVTAGVKLEVAGELTTYHGKLALIDPAIVSINGAPTT